MAVLIWHHSVYDFLEVARTIDSQQNLCADPEMREGA